jgi:hypothetical protein
MSGFVTAASAQGTADIFDRITDPGGGALTGATVTARDLATNVTQSRLYSIATLAAVFIFSGSQAQEQTIESLITGRQK